MTLRAFQDRTLTRSRARSERFVLARIIAPEIESEKIRTAADISFVLDRSGSMAGLKLDLAKQAIKAGIGRLSRRDSFSVVVYDEQVEIVAAATKATSQAKSEALSKMSSVHPRSTTNLGEGWLTGCGEVARFITDNRIGRCLLMTDGLANVGITDPGTLAMHAEELRRRGVSTSTFGVGEDYDEVLLGQMADAGGGAFTHIRGAGEIPALLDRELGETLEIAARGVSLQIRMPDHVRVTPIGPFPWHAIEDGISLTLPDLVSAQEFELPLYISLPRGQEGSEIAIELQLSDKARVLDHTPVLLSWTWASHEENDSQPREREVEYVIAERYAAMAREEAAAQAAEAAEPRNQAKPDFPVKFPEDASKNYKNVSRNVLDIVSKSAISKVIKRIEPWRQRPAAPRAPRRRSRAPFS